MYVSQSKNFSIKIFHFTLTDVSNFFSGLRIFLILRPHPGLAYPTMQRKCYWPTKVHTSDTLRCNSYWFLTTLVHIQDPLWLLSCWRCRALMMMSSPLLSPLWSQQHQRKLHVASSLTLSLSLSPSLFSLSSHVVLIILVTSPPRG